MVRMILARKSASPPTQSCNCLRDRIEEKSVDGEIAALGIGARVGEHHCLRPPAIAVIRFGAERGDLKLLFALDHDHDAKLASDGDGVREKLFDLLRQRGRGDVVIARLAAEQKIAHAAAHPEGGRSRRSASGGRWSAASCAG